MGTMTYDQVLGTLNSDCRCDGCERIRDAVRIAIETRGEELREQLRRAAGAVRQEDPCSPSSAAPGAPSVFGLPSDERAETTCPKCGAAVPIPWLRYIPQPTMLKASLRSSDDSTLARQVLFDIDEALSELERLGGDAPHRAVPVVSRMKALFWLVAREVANRAYQGGWNQSTDGRPLEERHFKAFTRSVIDGQVPREWEPKP